MEVTLLHDIEYEVTEPVAVEDLIKSLEANARLMRNAGTLLTAIAPGLQIEPQRISVVRLSQDSPLKELLAFATVITYQKELEEEVPSLIEAITGFEVSDRYDTLVTVLVMLIAIYGISKAFETIFPGRDKGALDSAAGALLRRAARITGVAARRIHDAIEVLFTGRHRRALVGASQRVFAPTRNQPSASIRSSTGDVLVSPAAVRDAQGAAGIPYDPEDEDAPNTVAEFHRDMRIIVHAMDRDRKRLGWAGHIPSLFDERIPMHLEKSLDPEALFGRGDITGDVLLTLEEDENGDMRPKEFLLIQADL